MAPHRITESVFRRLCLAAFVPLVALVFLLGAGAAQAVPEVLFEDIDDDTKATGILNLDVDGYDLPFNVDFVAPADAEDIYGPFPGDLTRLSPFFTLAQTEVAANAANLALSTQDALSIGDVGVAGTDVYNIGYITFLLDEVPLFDDLEFDAIAVVRSANETGEWVNLGENFLSYNVDEGRGWAVFTPVPEPGTALLLGLGLAGLGVVRRSRRQERGTV